MIGVVEMLKIEDAISIHTCIFHLFLNIVLAYISIISKSCQLANITVQVNIYTYLL